MAAITLKQAFAGYIHRYGSAADAFDKQMDALRVRYNEVPLQGAKWFRTETAKTSTFKMSDYGTATELPRINEDTESLPYTAPIKGFPKTFTLVNYRLAMRTDRTSTEDELFPVIRSQMSGLLNSGRLLLEYSFADIINNLTSTGTAYVGADGVAIASASHPHERRATGTWSNIETGAALTAGTFSTARKNMRKRTNEFGYPMPVIAKELVTGPDNEEVAKQIQASEKVPSNALNNKNIWMNTFDVTIYDYQSSTTQWMLIGDIPKEKSGFVYIERIAPNVMAVSYENPDVLYGARLRMRIVVGAVDGKNIQYNAGA